VSLDSEFRNIFKPRLWFFLTGRDINGHQSRAAQRYHQAQLNGSPADKARENVRRAVRELFAVFLYIALAVNIWQLVWWGWRPLYLYASLLIAFFCFVPVWALYRLVSFALAR
jgi:Flp pilus assembly protein TadB